MKLAKGATPCFRCVTASFHPAPALYVCEKCGGAVCAGHIVRMRGSKTFYELCSDCEAHATSAMQSALDKYAGAR